jgi:hypothetical protein
MLDGQLVVGAMSRVTGGRIGPPEDHGHDAHVLAGSLDVGEANGAQATDNTGIVFSGS